MEEKQVRKLLILMVAVILFLGCATQKQLMFHQEYTEYLKRDLDELADLWKQEKLAKEKVTEEYRVYKVNAQSLVPLIRELVMIDTMKAEEILKKYKMIIDLKGGRTFGYKDARERK